jgi:predicted dehydrogenase
MPGVEHTGNSKLTTIITGDMDKARILAEKYNAKSVYRYEQYAEALCSGEFDAVYLALPNAQHRQPAFTCCWKNPWPRRKRTARPSSAPREEAAPSS